MSVKTCLTSYTLSTILYILSRFYINNDDRDSGSQEMNMLHCPMENKAAPFFWSACVESVTNSRRHPPCRPFMHSDFC